MRPVAVLLFLIITSPATAAAQLPLLVGCSRRITDVNLFGVVGLYGTLPIM
jgi:hypothetical protein